MFDNYTPGDLLEEQLEKVEELREELLFPRYEEDDRFFQAAEELESMKEMTFVAQQNNYGASALFSNIKEFLKIIFRQQDFYEKIVYQEEPEEKSNDKPHNLLRWLKLYASVHLERTVELRHEFVFETFNEFREGQDHSTEDTPAKPGRKPDPVQVSMQVLIWRVVEDVLELWGELLTMGDFEQLTKNGELEGEEMDGEYGFIQELDVDEGEGRVRSFNRGEEGPYCTFEPPVEFFPSEGDIVYVVYPDNPYTETAEQIEPANL
jgi:hypothetical protein